MRDFETRTLTRDAALMVAQNFCWFGWYFKAKRLSNNRYQCRARRWAWSFIVLTPEDYA